MDILKLYSEAKEKGIEFEIRTDYFRNALIITATKGDFHSQAVISMDEATALNFPTEDRLEYVIKRLIHEVEK